MYIQSIGFHQELGNASWTDLELLGENGTQISMKVRTLDISLTNIPHRITILSRNRIILDGTEYSVLEPVTVSYDRIMPPSTTTTGTPFSRTELNDDNEDFIDYYNMHCGYYGYNASFPSDGGYITTSLTYSNDLVDIELEVYITPDILDQIAFSWERHTLRIYNDRKDIITIGTHSSDPNDSPLRMNNAQRFYVLRMEIKYK